ncbi:MAG: hypothetical protein HQK54_13475, partial [Oligoflexales bacterium]|nr:hypothetical protein [Oligoflexales bacterium]
SLGFNFIIFESNFHHLAREFIIKGDGYEQEEKIIEIDWAPIIDDNEEIERILVVLRDVTQVRKYKAVFQQQEEELGIISELLNSSKASFHSFMNTVTQLFAENRKIIKGSDESSANIERMFINLHTIKAAARSLGYKKFTTAIHHGEQKYKMIMAKKYKWNQDELLNDLDELDVIRDTMLTISHKKLGWDKHEDSGSCRFTAIEIKDLLAKIRKIDVSHIQNSDRAALQDIHLALEQKIYLSLKDIINEISASAEKLAIDLGKISPIIIIEDNGYKLSTECAEPLKNTFIHLFRNSLDHGIEKVEERIALKKPEHGKIHINMEKTGNMLRISYRDDGRGLNLLKLKKIGFERGFLDPRNPDPDLGEICRLIFIEGLSTRENITEISGQGIGMSAVRTIIENMGCKINIVISEEKFDMERVPFEFHILMREEMFKKL